MNKKALRIFFILIALLLVVLCSVSCTDSYLNDESNKFKTPSVSDKTPGATVNVPDNAKGSIKFGLFECDTLNPLETNNKAVQKYMSLVYDSLIYYDIECKPVGKIADSWKTSDGGITWEINIKNNVYFHDGANLTVYDVKNTLEWLKNNDSYYSYCAEGIVEYKVISQYDIQIILEKEEALFPYQLIFPVMKSEDLGTQFTSPNGTGMYKYSATKDNSYSFVINENYYGKFPKIKNIEIMCFDDSNALFESSVDVILNYGDNVIKYAKTDNYTVSQFEDDIVSCMVPSSKIDIETKHFVNNAINKELLVRAAMADCAFVPDAFLPQETYFMKGFNAFNSTNKGTKPEKLKFIVSKQDEDLIRISNFVATELKKEGVLCEVITLEAKEFAVAINTEDYDFAFLNYELRCVPDVEEYFAPLGGMNYNKFSDDSVTSLIFSLNNAYKEAEISGVVDTETFLSYSNGQTLKIAARLNEVLPVISLCRKNASVLLSENVTGVSLYNFNFWDTISFANWEVRTDK